MLQTFSHPCYNKNLVRLLGRWELNPHVTNYPFNCLSGRGNTSQLSIFTYIIAILWVNVNFYTHYLRSR